MAAPSAVEQHLLGLLKVHGVAVESLPLKVNLLNDADVLRAINDVSRLRGVLRDLLAYLRTN